MNKNILLAVGLFGALSLQAMDCKPYKKARVICAATYYDDIKPRMKHKFIKRKQPVTDATVSGEKIDYKKKNKQSSVRKNT